MKNNLKSLRLLKQKEGYKIFSMDSRYYQDTTAFGPKNIRYYQDTTDLRFRIIIPPVLIKCQVNFQELKKYKKNKIKTRYQDAFQDIVYVGTCTILLKKLHIWITRTV
jgi:hypothetical protein